MSFGKLMVYTVIAACAVVGLSIGVVEATKCPALRSRWRWLKRKGDDDEASLTKYEAQRYECEWAQGRGR